MPYTIGKNPKDIKALDSVINEPVNLFKSVSSFETGEVYQVLFMDSTGIFK